VWVWEVLQAYSDQMKALTDLHQGGHTAEEERAEIRTIAVRHGVPLEVTSTKLKTRPIGVLVLACPVRCETPVFEALGEGEMRVTFYFTASPPPAGDVEVTVKMVGG